MTEAMRDVMLTCRVVEGGLALGSMKLLLRAFSPGDASVVRARSLSTHSGSWALAPAFV